MPNPELNHEPVTYRPEQTILQIEGEPVIDWDEISVSPMTDEEYTSNKSTDGQSGWRHDPDPRSTVTITFSGGLPGKNSAGKDWRNWFRQNMGNEFQGMSVQDKSGTKDSVTMQYCRIPGQPELTRSNDEANIEVTILCMSTSWKGGAET